MLFHSSGATQCSTLSLPQTAVTVSSSKGCSVPRPAALHTPPHRSTDMPSHKANCLAHFRHTTKPTAPSAAVAVLHIHPTSNNSAAITHVSTEACAVVRGGNACPFAVHNRHTCGGISAMRHPTTNTNSQFCGCPAATPVPGCCAAALALLGSAVCRSCEQSTTNGSVVSCRINLATMVDGPVPEDVQP
jgi:hypothetical protein